MYTLEVKQSKYRSETNYRESRTLLCCCALTIAFKPPYTYLFACLLTYLHSA